MQGRNPPHNCTQAYSKDGDHIFPYRTYTADQTQAKFLSKDVEEGIRCVQMYIFFEEAVSSQGLKMTWSLDFLSGTCGERWRTRKVRQITLRYK